MYIDFKITLTHVTIFFDLSKLSTSFVHGGHWQELRAAHGSDEWNFEPINEFKFNMRVLHSFWRFQTCPKKLYIVIRNKRFYLTVSVIILQRRLNSVREHYRIKICHVHTERIFQRNPILKMESRYVLICKIIHNHSATEFTVILFEIVSTNG